MDREADGHAVSERLRRLSTCGGAWNERVRRQVLRAADALLPARCVLCGDPAGRDALCTPCLKGLPGLAGLPLCCPRCALPFIPHHDPGSRESPETCGACQRNPPPWHHVTATLRYDFPANRLVRALKYHGDFAAGAALAQAMWLGPKPVPPESTRRESEPPWIVPVPLHGWRERRRGFNQAMALALPLTRATGWRLVDGLRRIRRTPPQARLNGQQRRLNLRDAFRWRGPSPAGQTLVLVDDVLTTGATLEACTRAIPEAGVVCAWVATRAVPRDQSDRRAQRS